MTIQITTLPNGLRVVSDRMNEAESVVLGAWVGVGARHEPASANGIAHMTEHMLFKGTQTRSAYALSTTIEKNGGSMNAYTTREQTAYYARVLPEDTARATDIIADMVQHSVFAPKEMNRERQVIIQEIGRDFDTPEDHIGDLLQQVAFPGQTLGRPILGTAPIIAAMPREKIVRYVERFYHAGNMVFAAAGKVDHAELVELAKQYFGNLPRGKRALITKAHVKGGEKRLTKDSEQLHLMLAFPGPSYKARTAHVAGLLGLLLGGSSSSRLFQKVREKRGLVYHISTGHMAFEDTGLFTLYAGTDPLRLRELIPVICAELRDVTTHITPSELARAKAQARADILMDQESVTRRAEALGSQMLSYGHPIALPKLLAKIKTVTTDDVQTMASALFSAKPSLATIGQAEQLEPYGELRKRLSP